ncbi:MAG TPA: SRPBCC family protein [Pyrinomonadaceae bacterium]|nr:SRPBCC family protein [Pyrinomonadaceae bacterium]
MLRYESFIEVDAPVELVFDMLADFEAYPSWMGGVRDVRRTGARTTHWVAETALDVDVEWDAETTVFNPDRRIVWRAFRGDIHADGEAVLAQTERGTTVLHYVLGYDTPAGRSGERAAQFFGEHPLRRLERDLARFRRLAERKAGRQDGRPGTVSVAPRTSSERDPRGFRPASRSDDRRGGAPRHDQRRSPQDRGGWGYEEIQRRHRHDPDGPEEGRQHDGREPRRRDSREQVRHEGRDGGQRHAVSESGRGREGREPGGVREALAGREVEREQPRRHALSPREREAERERERGGEGRRGYESDWFERRGVDHLLDEPPSRGWRR